MLENKIVGLLVAMIAIGEKTVDHIPVFLADIRSSELSKVLVNLQLPLSTIYSNKHTCRWIVTNIKVI